MLHLHDLIKPGEQYEWASNRETNTETKTERQNKWERGKKKETRRRDIKYEKEKAKINYDMTEKGGRRGTLRERSMTTGRLLELSLTAS